ncbi:MAG: lipoprotein-releasing system ATP-binding protein LolD [Gemmatimonadetes bacterium]|jgi:lipoprotein-releasing system ATP-binding protein|nr:lipoprotein-releasing system ATP-binding protein LolD [Gemmatimonadota bacterium]MEE2862722.1 ABC transporter ATP-binding protein [Gemmatimonadota bacterium]|tara:strand:- start:1915 stop:2634 length:720 start_codon:yes stop_codon:yes gene_type:complete
MGKSSIITEVPGLPLEARCVHKSFKGGDGSELQVLTGVDLRLARNETVAVTGASGAGKSTLLHILGGLDRPTEGEVFVEGTSLTGLEDEALAAVRNRRIGFVFQFHHLLREFTAIENVMMPALIAGLEEHEARTKAEHILADVGLSERLRHKPSALSGGEQQRVAVARSLVNDPVVLLADEPSGNLDADTSTALHDLLFELQERVSLSILVVTHNLDLASRADRILVMEKGGLQRDAMG